MTIESFARPVEAVLRELRVDPREGLGETEASKRLSEHGPNRLREAKRKSTWTILFDQFRSLIVGFLFAAMAVALVTGDHLEAFAIGIVILLNGLIGFVSELQAVRSMEALRRLGEVPAVVRREGKASQRPAQELVPGDIVLVEGGDVVSADLRLVEASKLQADEAALTGESMPVDKAIDPLPSDTPLAERKCMLYKGSAVTRGAGAGVVVATGMGTEIGQITSLVDETFDTGRTPLEERLGQLGRSLIGLAVGITVVVAAAGILRGRDTMLMIETALALAVAAIPEGLPIVATLALARGMFRLARRNAVINRLAAVETLGATNLICTDKTGTLTEGQMTVRQVLTSASALSVTGGAWASDGAFTSDGGTVQVESSPALRALLEIAVLCNNAQWTDGEGEREAVGDPLEVALLVAGRKAGLERKELLRAVPEVREVAFDPEVKMMATYHDERSSIRIAVKGAPESVLGACSRVRTESGEDAPLSDPSEWERRNHRLAEQGLRVIALAEKRAPNRNVEPYEDLCLLGFVGLVDPPRSDVSAAIRSCIDAGIRVVMLTGDQVPTARYVGREVGLDVDEAPIIEGRELRPPDEMTREERERVLESEAFARVTPAQKLELVRLYQSEGLVVAMTGDGVNDAPALKQADIGIAMGLRGTQVAREAADMVLRDDAFASILASVRQGRVIFGNIRSFIRYLLSCNLSEILVVLLASLASAPLPILPLQILFLNLVTDVFPALALGFGEGSDEVMAGPPRDPSEPILTRAHWLGIAGYGVLLAAAVLGAFAFALGRLDASEELAVTVSFLTLALAQLWHVFNMRAPGSTMLGNGVIRNPWVWAALSLCGAILVAAVYVPVLAEALGTRDPGWQGWFVALSMSLVPLGAGQATLAARGFRRTSTPAS